jgi:HPt (histidine-containing phosphotransfer) domain-containing protein
VAGKQELLRQLGNLFLKEGGKLMAEVNKAIQDADAVRLRRAAHTLGSSAGCFGARATVEAAFRLELMGRDNNLDGAEAASAALQTELDRMTRALAARLEVPEPRTAP